MNLKVQGIIPFIFLFSVPVIVAAQQTDTVKKYANGNILVRQLGSLVVKSPVGAEIGELQPVFKGNDFGERKMVFQNEEYKKIHKAQNNIHKYGLFNFSTGTIVIPAMYDNIRALEEHGAGIVTTQSGKKYGAFSITENKTIDTVYRAILTLNGYKDFLFFTDTVTYFFNSKLQVTDSIAGMKDLKMLSIKHRDTNYRIAILTRGESLITNDNKLVHANRWKRIADFTGNFLVAATDKGFGLFNMTSQKFIEPCQFRSYRFRAFYNQQVLLGRPGLWKLFDSSGRQLMRIAADSVVPALNEWGGFYFKKNGLWGVASVKGKILMKPSWKELDLTIYTNITVTLPDGTRKDYYFDFIEKNGEIEITKVLEGSQVMMGEN
jgi:WG containing repeat